MNQPKRILNKSRRKYSTSRLSSGSNGANEDGWYKTHPKAKAKKKNKKTSLVDSDCESLLSQSDDDDNDEVVALGSSKKLKKPSKFAKKKVTSWNNNDSSSSDDVSVNQSSSSSESDESIAGVKKKKKKDKKKKQKTTNSIKPSNITNKQSKVQVSKPTRTVTTKSKKKIVSKADMSEAETKANKVSIPEDITSIDQLQWYKIKLIQTEQRTKERLQPCRVLSLGEAAKHSTTGNNSKRKVVIQYITFPNINNGIYKTIDNDNNLLIPFGYKSRDGISTTFNDDYLQRYINQQSTKASGLEVEKIYIKRLFMHAANMERKAREDRKRDYQAYHDDDSSSDNSSGDGNSDSSDEEEVTAKRKVAAAESRKVAFEVDSEDSDSDDESNNGMMDELDVPYTQAITFDPDDFGIGGSDDEEEQSNEPIRPGDVIEYYSPIFVAGDARGLRQATVLSTDPNDDMPLVLSNGEGLPTNTKVKRIKVNEGGDLLDHSGIFRPIYRFKLSKRGTATAADGVAHEAARFTKIMQKNMSKLKEKAEADGFAPMDMINGGKWNVDTSKSKQPSNSKITSRRKDDDSSSEDDNDSCSCKDEKPRSKKASTSTSRPALNKENNGTESSDKEKQSEGSLSSGSSLSEDDDDSSIESVKAKGRKAKKSRDNHVDLSFMSDDDGENERYTSTKKSAKAIVRSTSKSTGLTFNTESSCESPTQSYSKDMPISKPTSNSASRRRLKLDCFNPAYQSNNEKKQSLSEKVSRRKEELPSSPSSSSSSSDSSISTNSVKRKKSCTSGRKRSASSDSVELISDTKRNLKPKATISKKRQSPLSSDDESSSDDSSDDDIPTKSRGNSKQLKRGQSSNSSMSSTNHITKSKKTREPPTQERTDLGWTKSKIGWTKKGDSVGSKSPAFSIMKANNKNGKKSPGLGIMRVK